MQEKFKTKKSLGQNFLINPHIIDKIVVAAQIKKSDIILEVGPGTGNLTRELAKKAGKVIAIEKDVRLLEPLRDNFRDKPNIEIIEGDILKFDIETLFRNLKLEIRNSDYKVVANLPYYITSNFIRTVFDKWSRPSVEDPRFSKTESGPRPELIVLTIQKEVAQRIMAKPPHMNLLALSVQYYSEPEIIGYISKNNFRPIPKIDSAIIRLSVKSKAQNEKETEAVFKIIRLGFSEKRKQLASVLSKKLKRSREEIALAIEKSGISPKVRAENLSFEQWNTLQNYLNT